MAKTAVINRRRRKRTTKRRRRNYGAAAATANPRRRRRRRSYGAAAPRRRRGRRRNPVSPYSSTGYRREPNPAGMFGLGQLVDIVPAGTAGVMGARFALRQVAPMAPGEKPGIWQAVALYLGAHATGAIISHLFRSPSKGLYAKIGALSFGGDLFARTRIFANSEWVRNNLSLAGLGYDDEEDSTEYYDEGEVNGFQSQSALGEEFTDAGGNTWMATDRGWALAGVGASGDLVRDDQGNLYQLSGGMGLDSGPGAGSRLAGFQQQSALGAPRAYSNPNSSFGYSP